jgi:hypothetical protein
MLKGFIFMFVLFAAWIVAVFAFSQIVGCIKYKVPNCFLPVFIWSIILIGGIIITNAWLSSYKWATYIAYAVGFFMSLKTTPDN